MKQTTISSRTRLLALIGYPARHSLSPYIQNIFLRDNNIDGVYLTFEFPGEKLINAFNGAKDLGIYGLNITMPYKEKIYQMADDKDISSIRTGSVNTIRFDPETGRSKGFNTDIDGFTASFKEAAYSLEDKECLIIGAGGAARSAVFAFLSQKARKIYIYNRTSWKGKSIRQLFSGGERKKIEIIESFDPIIRKEINIDIICNCTPLGMNTQNMIDKIPIPENLELRNKMIFETIYDPIETGLIKKAKNEGAGVIDGLDMLINQAASSFNIWFGIVPSINKIKPMLLNNLKDLNDKESHIKKYMPSGGKK